MSMLTSNLERFFTVHLLQELNASANTIAAYPDTGVLLLGYMQEQTKTLMNQMDLAIFEGATAGAFLTYLHAERGNNISTGNARMASIRAF